MTAMRHPLRSTLIAFCTITAFIACKKEDEAPTPSGNPGTDPVLPGYCILLRINNEHFEPLTVCWYDPFSDRIDRYVEFDRYTGAATNSVKFAFQDSAGIVAIDSMTTYQGDINNGGVPYECRFPFYHMVGNVAFLDSAEVHRYVQNVWVRIAMERWVMNAYGTVDGYYIEHDQTVNPALQYEDRSILYSYDAEGRVIREDVFNYQGVVTSFTSYELSPYLNPKAAFELNPQVGQAKRFAATKLTVGASGFPSYQYRYIVHPNPEGYARQIDHILSNNDTVAWNLYEYDCYD